MIACKIRQDGKVEYVRHNAKTHLSGEMLFDALPIKPTVSEGERASLAYRGGELVWDMEIIQAPQAEEPIPMTEEDIAEERKRSYVAECDSLLIAWMGYTAEGDEAKAESARRAYLRAKAEVRKRLPYAECDQYQRAYLGYTLEGDTEKAESARKAYLKAKAEVRKRLPYNDTAEEEVVIPLSRDDDLL